MKITARREFSLILLSRSGSEDTLNMCPQDFICVAEKRQPHRLHGLRLICQFLWRTLYRSRVCACSSTCVVYYKLTQRVYVCEEINPKFIDVESRTYVNGSGGRRPYRANNSLMSFCEEISLT